MSKSEKYSIDLPLDLSASIQSAIASGEYESASAVVQEALEDWTENKALPRFTVEELRRLWDEGMASGPSQPFVIEDIIAKAKDRLERSIAKSA